MAKTTAGKPLVIENRNCLNKNKHKAAAKPSGKGFPEVKHNNPRTWDKEDYIMVVQHNMQAANANRMLNVTTGQQAKSTEKLSSGYRINRAADDAAGLTISEKMRKQIKGTELQQMQRMAFQLYRQQKVPSQRFTQCFSV